MPLKENATVEDVIRVIVDTTNMMAEGYRRPGDGHDEQAAIGIGNTAYWILRRLGLTDAEAKEMFAALQQGRQEIEGERTPG